MSDKAEAEIEARIRAEAEKCAQAIKLLGNGELRFMPDGVDNSELLARFLLELEKQCGKIGAAARIVFCFYPMTPAQLNAQLGAELRAATPASDKPPPTAAKSIH
jgi:hypothetical protein